MRVGQGTAGLAIHLTLTLYLTFFFIRDGSRLLLHVRAASPLDERHTEMVASRFVSVVRATVRGTLVVAVVQGTIGGLTFWILGIESALLWGAAMALLSLLPLLGATLIWAPASAIILFTGEVARGLILLAVGTAVISLIDNILRPIIVGKDLRLPDFLILMSTIGGLTLIGINGFVVGPMIAAFFVASWAAFSDIRTER
ncbi:AI-2E family transporter [Arenibacterium sp. LLYu02]|uniref:AI-2E family transporter n=1 Tax=Arenibacterium sp. LLYu02 TaxID=3404132 RepID=UPI003B20C494